MKQFIVYLMFIVTGVAALAIGCYLGFFETRGYETTTAVIERMEEYQSGTDDDGDPEYSYNVFVRYTVDGTEYHGELDYYEGGYAEGKEIKIFYHPENPEQIHGDGAKVGFAFMAAGVVFALAGAVPLTKRILFGR